MAIATTQEELNGTSEQHVPEIDSKYRLIIVAAKRSKQLQRGARPRISPICRVCVFFVLVWRPARVRDTHRLAERVRELAAARLPPERFLVHHQVLAVVAR